MKKTLVICCTIVICLSIVCFTYYYIRNKYIETSVSNLSKGEQEAISYIREQADKYDMTVSEYIKKLKSDNAKEEYFEKVSKGTNTQLDDYKASKNGWIDKDVPFPGTNSNSKLDWSVLDE